MERKDRGREGARSEVKKEGKERKNSHVSNRKKNKNY